MTLVDGSTHEALFRFEKAPKAKPVKHHDDEDHGKGDKHDDHDKDKHENNAKNGHSEKPKQHGK